jgi:hypothetical protein
VVGASLIRRRHKSTLREKILAISHSDGGLGAKSWPTPLGAGDAMWIGATLKALGYYTCACEQALPGTQRPRNLREAL